MENRDKKTDREGGWLRQLISSLGPGLIIAATVFGAGSIITASKAGASAGYSYLWVLALAAVFMITFTKIAAKIGCVGEKSMLGHIEDNYSRGMAVLFGLCCSLICTGFQAGNNINTGVALNALFPFMGIKVWIIVSFLIIMVLIWRSSSFYQLLEKIMTVMVLIMLVCFAGNIVFFFGRIHYGELALGFIPGKVSGWQIIVSMSATTFSIAGAACQSYLVQGKGWTMDNYDKAGRDSTAGIIILSCITAIILITAATILPKGAEITSVLSIAALLKPLLGEFANGLFLLGFFAAVFSSVIANAVIGGTFLADSLKLGKTINDFWVKMFSSIIIALGACVGLIFGSNPIQLTIMAQGATIIGAPLVTVMLMLLSSKESVLGKHKNSKVTTVIGWVAVLWVVFLSVNQILLWNGIAL